MISFQVVYPFSCWSLFSSFSSFLATTDDDDEPAATRSTSTTNAASANVQQPLSAATDEHDSSATNATKWSNFSNKPINSTNITLINWIFVTPQIKFKWSCPNNNNSNSQCSNQWTRWCNNKELTRFKINCVSWPHKPSRCLTNLTYDNDFSVSFEVHRTGKIDHSYLILYNFTVYTVILYESYYIIIC